MFEFRPISIAVDDEVELNVAVPFAQPQPAHGEIRAAENCLCDAAVRDMVHLAVQQVRLPNGLDVYLLLDPRGTFPCHALLLEFVGEFQPIGINQEGFFFGLVGVEAINELGLAEQKIEVLDLTERPLKGVVGVNREIRRNDGEVRTLPDFFG